MSRKKWRIIHGHGINGENQSFDFLFSSGLHNFVLLGSERMPEDLINKRFSNFTGIIYFSADSGATWRESKIGKGEFTAYAVTGNSNFVALKVAKGDEIIASSASNSEIYRSDGSESSWSKIATFGSFYVKNIFCCPDDRICVLGKNIGANYWTLLVSEDRGLSWNKIGMLSNDAASPVLLNNDLFYLSKNKSGNLMKISTMNGETVKVALPDMGVRPQLLNVVNDHLYLAASSSKGLNIYKYRTEDSSFISVTAIKENRFPKQIYSVDNRLILLLGERNSIGVTYSVYSQDVSGHWVVDDVPSSYFEPFVFYGRSILGYTNDGNFYEKDILDF